MPISLKKILKGLEATPFECLTLFLKKGRVAVIRHPRHALLCKTHVMLSLETPRRSRATRTPVHDGEVGNDWVVLKLEDVEKMEFGDCTEGMSDWGYPTRIYRKNDIGRRVWDLFARNQKEKLDDDLLLKKFQREIPGRGFDGEMGLQKMRRKRWGQNTGKDGQPIPSEPFTRFINGKPVQERSRRTK